ncbi:MAG: selenite/tellurite reduction operon porin ExtI [Nitrospirota bacterium]
MNGIPKLILFLFAGAVLLCMGTPEARAFDPMTFGEEGAFLKIDFQGQLYGVWRDTGSGPDKTSSTTDLFFRRNRVSFWGHGNDIYGFIVQIEYTGERDVAPLGINGEPQKDFSALDAYFMADVSNYFRVYAGKQKIQLTRENLEDCFEPLSLDRSLFIYTPFKHSRDTGLVLWGNIPEIQSQYRLEASKGKDDIVNAPKSSLMYSGRFHVSLLEPEYAYGYKGTYLGGQKVLTIGGGAQYEPGAVFSDITAKTGQKNYSAWTADIFFNYPIGEGAVTASAAYLETDFGEAYKGGDPDPEAIGIDGEKKGWYAKAGFLLPGKKIQPFARYEEWRFASLYDVYNQKIKWTGAGANYYIDGQSLRITVEYARTNFDKESNTESQDFKTVTAMLQYRF